jgi:hypothetical protein
MPRVLRRGSDITSNLTEKPYVPIAPSLPVAHEDPRSRLWLDDVCPPRVLSTPKSLPSSPHRDITTSILRQFLPASNELNNSTLLSNTSDSEFDDMIHGLSRVSGDPVDIILNEDPGNKSAEMMEGKQLCLSIASLSNHKIQFPIFQSQASTLTVAFYRRL